jgi:SAM-dependent methyltransferase
MLLPHRAGRLTMRPGYFDALYTGADDPWGLAERFYERRKRALLLASLPRERFARAFEPGCATGLITHELGLRCEQVVATDIAPRAVALARDRCEQQPHVLIEQADFPAALPVGTFELVVLSEVGYYCPDLDVLRAAVDALLSTDGVLVACHWRHDAPDHPHSAGAVHSALGIGRHRLAQHSEDDFLLDVWSGRALSVAQRDGIV